MNGENVKARLESMGIEISHCNKCNEEIIFLKTKRGKWMPVDMELEPHWQSCPHADDFRTSKG